MLARVVIVITISKNSSLDPAIFFDNFSKLIQFVAGNRNNRASCPEPRKTFFKQFSSDSAFLVLRFHEKRTNFSLFSVLFQNRNCCNFAIDIAPEELDYNVTTLIVLIGGIIIKFVLGLYVKKKGRAIKSDSLVASGADAFNDAILSISVLASAIVYMIFNVNLEAYVGALVSVFIIKAGIELIKESINNVLGTRIESSLAKSIKKEVLKEKNVKGAFDLALNDYGPDKYLGSIHIEVEDTLSVADIDKISRRITKQVSQKYGVILHTIGVYSINTKDKNIIEAKKKVEKIVFAHKEVLQMHGFHLDAKDKTLSFDIIIDFKAENCEKIYQDIYDAVQKEFKNYKITIVLDVDVSD